MRKIIQIAMNPETENNFATLVALCDDGTLWQTWFESPEGLSFGEDWERIPLVPHPPEAEQPHSPAPEQARQPASTAKPFTVHCGPDSESFPWIRGNGFDGLRIAGTPEEAYELVTWVNEKLGFPKDPNPS